MKNPYEDSKYDKDKGVKEGSKADMARDKAGVAKMKADYAKQGKSTAGISAHHGNSRSRGK